MPSEPSTRFRFGPTLTKSRRGLCLAAVALLIVWHFAFGATPAAVGLLALGGATFAAGDDAPARKSRTSARAIAHVEAYQMDPRYRLSGAFSPLGHLPYADIVERKARDAGLDPALLHAVLKTESAYNARALSPKGAIGLMQLMPDTARRYGVRNARDPAQNIAGGTAYLRDLLGLFDHDLPLALAAYNAGENEVIRRGYRIPPFAETRSYVPKVLAEYDSLRRGSVRRSGPYRLAPDWQSRLAEAGGNARE